MQKTLATTNEKYILTDDKLLFAIYQSADPYLAFYNSSLMTLTAKQITVTRGENSTLADSQQSERDLVIDFCGDRFALPLGEEFNDVLQMKYF